MITLLVFGKFKNEFGNVFIKQYLKIKKYILVIFLFGNIGTLKDSEKNILYNFNVPTNNYIYT